MPATTSKRRSRSRTSKAKPQKVPVVEIGEKGQGSRCEEGVPQANGGRARFSSPYQVAKKRLRPSQGDRDERYQKNNGQGRAGPVGQFKGIRREEHQGKSCEEPWGSRTLACCFGSPCPRRVVTR